MNSSMNNLEQKAKWRILIASIIYAKQFAWKKQRIAIFSYIYNFFILSLSLIGIVPIIFSFIYPTFRGHHQLNALYITLLVVAFIYIFDYFLRLLTIDIFYETKTFAKALAKQLWSLHSNYQLICAILIIMLMSIFAKIDNDGYLTFGEKGFNTDVAMVVFSVILLINCVGIFPRIIIQPYNQNNFTITKRIIYTKRKSIILIFAIMIISLIMFSYIIFIFERDSNSNINNMGDAIYYSFIVMTTVGLGEVTPYTNGGKIFTVLLGIFGVSFYAYVGSIFVNLYVEYINKKKQIRHEAIVAKLKQSDYNKLIENMNEIVLKNLYLAGLIKKTKYDSLIASLNKSKKCQKNVYSINDFDFSNENELLLNGEVIGQRITNKEDINKAQKEQWIAQLTKPEDADYPHNVLYQLPIKFINKIKSSSHIPIVFSSQFVDEDINKVIVYSKKPMKTAHLQMQLHCTLTMEKENVWKYFGHYVDMTKSKFESKFKNHERISVLVVKDFIVYSTPKQLELFGINSNVKLNRVIYLK